MRTLFPNGMAPIGTVLAALALVPAAPAAAQPEVAPKRDYAITYRVEGSRMGSEMRISYQASTKLQRIEGGGPAGMTMLIDILRGNMTMIDAANRRYIQMTGGESRPPWADTERYRFERAGSDRVANTACTVWRMVEGGERRGTACATDDGITLRAEWQRDGMAGKIEATQVSLAAQPAENFRVPAGFQRMEMPGMPPGLGDPPSGAPGAPGGPPRR
jgi:hypothetical protein